MFCSFKSFTFAILIFIAIIKYSQLSLVNKTSIKDFFKFIDRIACVCKQEVHMNILSVHQLDLRVHLQR